MNSFVVFVFVLVGQLAQSSCVNGKPAWIPSNVTFEKMNETHVQVKYRDKVDIIDLAKNHIEIKKHSDEQTNVTANCCNYPDKMLSHYNDKWIRVNLCYFNPVSCFMGKKN